MATEDLSEDSLKVLHANRIQYATVGIPDSSRLTAALALRYDQTAAFHKIPLAPSQTCPACAAIWMPGWTVQVRIIRTTSAGHLEKTRRLSSRARHRKTLRAEARQAKLREKLASSDKVLRKRKWTETTLRAHVVFKCLNCNMGKSVHDITEAERISYRPDSRSDMETLEPAKKKRTKSKKGNTLSKLVAKKEERSKGLSLGLADFLAK